MSPQRTEPAPRNGAKSTTIIALIAALLGGTGGIVITPRMNQTDLASKADLRDALAPIAGELKELRADVTNLREEVAVARYAREHRNTP